MNREYIIYLLASMSVFIAVMSLVARLLNYPLLATFGGGTPMAISTAVCIICLGTAKILQTYFFVKYWSKY